MQQIETDQCQQTVQVLVELFKNSFSDIYCFINLRMVIVERVYNLIHSENVTLPMNLPLYSPGANSHLMEWAEEFTQLIESEDNYQHGLQLLMDAWLEEVERHFHGLTHFAKQIPGFSELLLDDKIILLKQARGDAMHSLR